MGAMHAIGRTNRPNFFIFGGFFHFFIQKQLHRTLNIIAIFPTFIIEITIDRIHNRSIGKEMKKGLRMKSANGENLQHVMAADLQPPSGLFKLV